MDTHQDIYIGRQPIINREGTLVAFELLFRAGTDHGAEVTDDVTATTTVISNIISSFGVNEVIGRQHKGFLNLDAFLLMNDAIEILPKDRVVFELLESIEIDEAIVARCKELKARGFTLALDDFMHFRDAFIPLLEIVDIVKVDLLAISPDEVRATVAKLREWPVQLLAEKVDSPEQYQFCRELGFDLFQGYYFAKPLVVIGQHLSSSELGVMQLLQLLLADANTSEIEKLFKTQPELIMRLMRLVNSVGMGFPRKFTSIHDAIIAIGRNQLTRWLKLLLYSQTSHNGKSSQPLLQMASKRARLMELLAQHYNPKLADEAFMTGILSLLNALFNMPLHELTSSLNLSERIETALLHRTGELGELLVLSEKFERDDWQSLEETISNLSWLDMEKACAAQYDAIVWTNQVVENLGLADGISSDRME